MLAAQSHYVASMRIEKIVIVIVVSRARDRLENPTVRQANKQ